MGMFTKNIKHWYGKIFYPNTIDVEPLESIFMTVTEPGKESLYHGAW